MDATMLPPRFRRFFTGHWPWIWLAVACGYFVFDRAIPAAMDAADVRETASAERGLVDRQLALAAQDPAERERRDVVLRWWTEGQAQRIRGASLAQATADLQDRVRRLCERPGVIVTKLEASTPEPISDNPQAQLVRLTLRLSAERMEPLAASLLALETMGGDGATPWLRVGNTGASSMLYRLPGVQVETVVYGVVEAAQ